MARNNAMHKPGERAPKAGSYYCYTCSLRGETSTCEAQQEQMFLECPQCLERKVAEWDLVWKPVEDRPGKGSSRTHQPWPGSLAKPV
jgi:hypothetical protein